MTWQPPLVTTIGIFVKDYLTFASLEKNHCFELSLARYPVFDKGRNKYLVPVKGWLGTWISEVVPKRTTCVTNSCNYERVGYDFEKQFCAGKKLLFKMLKSGTKSQP